MVVKVTKKLLSSSPFVSKRYTKGVPFVQNGMRTWTPGRCKAILALNEFIGNSSTGGGWGGGVFLRILGGGVQVACVADTGYPSI